MRRECSVSLIRRLVLSRDRREHSCQITSYRQYAAFCKVSTFAKSRATKLFTTTEKSQLQLQGASICLNNQLDEIDVALSSRSLLKTQKMVQSYNVHVLGLGSRQARLGTSSSLIGGFVENEALGVYLAKVQCCSAGGGFPPLYSKLHLTSNLLQPQSTHVSMNVTTISGTCGMYSNVIDASVPLAGQSLSTSGFSEEKTL